MSKPIFEKHAANLDAIKRINTLTAFTVNSEKKIPCGYICPITLDYYDHAKYDDSSVVHVPQKSLAGHPLYLTNKKRNNDFGKYDKLALEES